MLTWYIWQLYSHTFFKTQKIYMNIYYHTHTERNHKEVEFITVWRKCIKSLRSPDRPKSTAGILSAFTHIIIAAWTPIIVNYIRRLQIGVCRYYIVISQWVTFITVTSWYQVKKIKCLSGPVLTSIAAFNRKGNTSHSLYEGCRGKDPAFWMRPT